jgi:hypothetical protein
MQRRVAIYLAGAIQKGHKSSDSLCWTDGHMAEIQENLGDFKALFLNPAIRSDDLTDQHSVFGRDMLQVLTSHIVFVDARAKRGLGVGAEMMWAKLNKIPVVTWAPKNTHYHQNETSILGVQVVNFVHPFVEALSDKIVDSPAEGARWIEAMMSDSNIQVKGRESIQSAMQYYRNTQLHRDQPMQDLLGECEELRAKVTGSLLTTILNG